MRACSQEPWSAVTVGRNGDGLPAGAFMLSTFAIHNSENLLNLSMH